MTGTLVIIGSMSSIALGLLLARKAKKEEDI